MIYVSHVYLEVQVDHELVKDLPAEQQRERAMMSIAARTLRTIMPRRQQSHGA